MIDKTKLWYAKVPIKIRKEPDIKSECLGVLKPGDSIEVLSMTPTWIQHKLGWSVRKFFSDNIEEVFKLAEEPRKISNKKRKARSYMSVYGDMYNDRDSVATPPIVNPDDHKPVDEDLTNGANKPGEVTSVDQNGNPENGSLVGENSVPSIQSQVNALTGGTSSELDFSTGLRGLWGMPYAFTDITDPIPGSIRRNSGEGQKWFYGRVYTETFLSDMPILIITAGVPSFMTQAKEEDKKAVLTMMQEGEDAEGKLTQYMNEAMDTTGLEYFTFKEQMLEYYGYVNFMCRGIASFLNLSSLKLSERLKNFFFDPFLGVDEKKDPAKINWYYYPKREEINHFAGESYSPYIACYVDPNSGGNESLSNSTTQSMLAGINSLSDKTRDMGFMFAHITGNDMKMYTDVNESLTKDFAGIQADSNLSQRFNAMISSSAAVLKNGGKMIFPEIWSDSQYQKSFSITAHFHSPYGDTMSIFLHVLVPFVHLFCLAAPRQLGVNGIMSPFLVRAYVKGKFCCTMGIIDSFSFKKGGGGDSWTLDALPVSIEVDMSITELYSSVSISRVENLTDTLSLGVSGLNYPLSNTMLLDFMANLTGSDLNVNQFSRKVKLVMIYMQSKYTDMWGDAPRKIYRKVRQTIGATIRKLGISNNL